MGPGYGLLQGLPQEAPPPFGLMPNMAQPQAQQPPQMAPINVSAPSPAMQQPPPRSPFLARMFGGFDPTANGLLNQGQQSALGKQGLLQLGLQLLGGSQAQRFGEFAPSTGQALAAGIQSGRESYAQGGQQAIGMQVMQARRGLAAALASADPVQIRAASGVLSALGQDDAAKWGLDEARQLAGEWKEATDPATGQSFLYNSATGQRNYGSGGQNAGPIRHDLIPQALQQEQDFATETEPHMNAQRAHSQALALAPAARAGNPIAQAQLLQSAENVLNPRNLSAAGIQIEEGQRGVLDRLGSWMQSLASGAKLNAADVNRVIQAEQSAYQAYGADYTKRLNRRQSTWVGTVGERAGSLPLKRWSEAGPQPASSY